MLLLLRNTLVNHFDRLTLVQFLVLSLDGGQASNDFRISRHALELKVGKRYVELMRFISVILTCCGRNLQLITILDHRNLRIRATSASESEPPQSANRIGMNLSKRGEAVRRCRVSRFGHTAIEIIDTERAKANRHALSRCTKLKETGKSTRAKTRTSFYKLNY